PHPCLALGLVPEQRGLALLANPWRDVSTIGRGDAGGEGQCQAQGSGERGQASGEAQGEVHGETGSSVEGSSLAVPSVRLIEKARNRAHLQWFAHLPTGAAAR